MRRQRISNKWDDFLAILGGLLLAGMLAIFLFGRNGKAESEELKKFIDLQWGHYAKEFLLSDGTPCVLVTSNTANNVAMSCGWGMGK